MKKSELFSLIQKLKDTYDKYKKELEFSKRIYLADGSIIIINNDDNKVPHLLGVNTNYLRSCNIYKSNNSKELFEAVLLYPDKLWKSYRDNIIDLNQLFSEYSMEKIKSFETNTKLNLNQIEFVALYDSETISFQGKYTENCDYIICSKDKDENFCLSFLVKNELGSTYSIKSNRFFENTVDGKKEILDICNGLVLTYATKISIRSSEYDNEKNFYIRSDNELLMQEKLKTWASLFDSKVDTSRQTSFYIKTYNDILSVVRYPELASSVKLPKEISAFFRDNSIKDYFCGEDVLKQADYIKSVTTENESLKEKVASCEEILAKKEDEISRLALKNSLLQSKADSMLIEIDRYKECLASIKKQTTFILKKD